MAQMQTTKWKSTDIEQHRAITAFKQRYDTEVKALLDTVGDELRKVTFELWRLQNEWQRLKSSAEETTACQITTDCKRQLLGLMDKGGSEEQLVSRADKVREQLKDIKGEVDIEYWHSQLSEFDKTLPGDVVLPSAGNPANVRQIREQKGHFNKVRREINSDLELLETWHENMIEVERWLDELDRDGFSRTEIYPLKAMPVTIPPRTPSEGGTSIGSNSHTSASGRNSLTFESLLSIGYNGLQRIIAPGVAGFFGLQPGSNGSDAPQSRRGSMSDASMADRHELQSSPPHLSISRRLSMSNLSITGLSGADDPIESIEGGSFDPTLLTVPSHKRPLSTSESGGSKGSSRATSPHPRKRAQRNIRTDTTTGRVASKADPVHQGTLPVRSKNESFGGSQ